MGAELVLRTRREPSRQEWIDAAAEDFGAVLVRQYQGGCVHLLDAEGNGLAAYWPPRHIENDRESRAMAGPAGSGLRTDLWIDVALRHGNEDAGRVIVNRLARSVGGTVWEETL